MAAATLFQSLIGRLQTDAVRGIRNVVEVSFNPS